MVADAAANGLREQLREQLARALAAVSWPDIPWDELTEGARSFCRSDTDWAMAAAEAYAAAQVAAKQEHLVVKIRKQADRYFTPRCDQDDHTYGHGLRYAAHLIEEEAD